MFRILFQSAVSEKEQIRFTVCERETQTFYYKTTYLSDFWMFFINSGGLDLLSGQKQSVLQLFPRCITGERTHGHKICFFFTCYLDMLVDWIVGWMNGWRDG